MSEINENVIVEETKEEVQAPQTDYKPPFFKNRYYSYDHYNSINKSSKLFCLLKDNEILQISSSFLNEPHLTEVLNSAKDNGIELKRYEPLSTDPYYWMRNGYVCKKIPIERIERHRGVHFDPSNLVE